MQGIPNVISYIDDILATRADDAAHLSHLAEVLKLMCHHVHTSTTSVVPTELWLKPKPLKMYLWQSRVEIEHYSVAYFARIAAFEAL